MGGFGSRGEFGGEGVASCFVAGLKEGSEESRLFQGGDSHVRTRWKRMICGGGTARGGETHVPTLQME